MSTPSDLQRSDFGDDDKLYDFYKGLSGFAKQEVDELPNVETKIKVLTDLSSKELSVLYTSLPEKEKKMLKSMKVKERMLMLKNILKTKQQISKKKELPINEQQEQEQENEQEKELVGTYDKTSIQKSAVENVSK